MTESEMQRKRDGKVRTPRKFLKARFTTNRRRNIKILPRMLCKGNGVLPHLQMGVAETGFVEDFR